MTCSVDNPSNSNAGYLFPFPFSHILMAAVHSHFAIAADVIPSIHFPPNLSVNIYFSFQLTLPPYKLLM